MSAVRWYVGIDWGPGTHAVCVLDGSGRVVEQRQLTHDAVALQAFVDTLLQRSQGQPATVAIGIERPHGAVVELLIERGFAVYAINPKQLDRFRDRFTVAGAKDDRCDARVLADSLRTDLAAFRRVAGAGGVTRSTSGSDASSAASRAWRMAGIATAATMSATAAKSSSARRRAGPSCHGVAVW